MTDTTKRVRERAKRAWATKQLFDPLWQDAYDYILPYRGGGKFRREAKGAARVDKIFDGAGPQAAMRFAGRVQSDLTPPFQDFFLLEDGPLAPTVLQKFGIDGKAFRQELQSTRDVVHAVTHQGQFHVASHEMYQDLFIGTAALLTEDSDDPEEPIRDVAVPAHEIALETDGWGKVNAIYWERDWKAGEIEETWPQGAFSESLRKLMRDKSDTDVPILQATVYDPKSRSWNLTVLDMRDRQTSPPIHTKTYRTNPWLTPRFWVVPGEPYGRGPGLVGLPYVKTLNKVQELNLHAAAFALLAPHTYRNDGIFNPDTVRWEPGALIPVSSNGGGPMGPTLQALNVPNRFDLNQFVLADQREQAQIAMLDHSLPPEDGAVRSATEIAGRMQRRSQDLGGAYSRLALEVVVPLVRRRVDILQGKGIIANKIPIDQLLVALKITSPISQTQNANKVQPRVDFMQIVASLLGPSAVPMVAKVEAMLPQIARDLGILESEIRSEKEQGLLEQWVNQQATQKAQMLVQQMQADEASQQPEALPQ